MRTTLNSLIIAITITCSLLVHGFEEHRSVQDGNIVTKEMEDGNNEIYNSNNTSSFDAANTTIRTTSTTNTPKPLQPSTTTESSGKIIVKKLKGAEDILVKRKTDISSLKAKVTTLLNKEKVKTTETMEKRTTDTNNITSTSSSFSTLSKPNKVDTDQDNRNSVDVSTSSSHSNKHSNFKNSTTTTALDTKKQEIESSPSIDEWENSTLAKLEKYSNANEEGGKNEHNNTRSKSSTDSSSNTGIISKIGNWLSGEGGKENNLKGKEEKKHALKHSEKEKDKVLEELKNSIRKQANLQRMERAKDKERMNALEEVVKELNDMEESMNQTQQSIQDAVKGTMVQEKKLENLEDERKKEKEIQKAADDLEKKVEELFDKGNDVRVDYETGKVIGGNDDDDEEGSNNQKNNQKTSDKDDTSVEGGLEKLGKSIIKKVGEAILGDKDNVDSKNGELSNNSNDNDGDKEILKKKKPYNHKVPNNIIVRFSEDSKEIEEKNKITGASTVDSDESNTFEKDNSDSGGDGRNDNELKNHDRLSIAEKKAEEMISKVKSLHDNSDAQNENKGDGKQNVGVSSASSIGGSIGKSNSDIVGNTDNMKNKQTRLNHRMKKALERAKKARRDADPALIESESGLIFDMSTLLIAASIGGMIATKLNLPTPLGFIVGGMSCGPSGMNLIKDIRQLQTLASLGSVFMLFALGVGFPINEVLRLRKIVITSTFVGQFLIIVVLSQVLQMTTFAHTLLAGLVVSSGIALSSTSIVLTHINHMERASQLESMIRKRRQSQVSLRPHGLRRVASIGLYGNIVLGMVACNEFTSAFFLSIPEILSFSSPAAKTSSSPSLGGISRIIILLFVGLIVFSTLLRYSPFKCCYNSYIDSCLRNKGMKCISIFAKHSKSFSSNHQLLVLTMVAFCLACSTLSAYVGLSLEMGAFVGGLLVSLASRTKNNASASSSSSASTIPLEQLENGTPSKPTYYNMPSSPTLRPSAAVVASVLGPLKNFFSFLYYATIGMALNPSFMFHNIHIIVGMTIGFGLIKTIIFGIALVISGAPMLTAITSGLVMSSVGEISLLYINKAHVMNESIITRRMMLLYMASTVFSLTFTPLVLRLLVPTDSIIEKEALQGGEKYTNTVKKMVNMDVELTSHMIDGSGLHGRRRHKERSSDAEDDHSISNNEDLGRSSH